MSESEEDSVIKDLAGKVARNELPFGRAVLSIRELLGRQDPAIVMKLKIAIEKVKHG